MERRSYLLIKGINVNEVNVDRVVIDPHVDKHSDHINDEKIMILVTKLQGVQVLPDSVNGAYEYYVSVITYEAARYKLIWLLEKGQSYLGVVIAFKDRRI